MNHCRTPTLLCSTLKCLPRLAAGLFLFAFRLGAAESPYLYGIHDHSPDPAEYLSHITNATGAGGWITATVAVGVNTNDLSGTDFTALANAGHTVICRINYSYYPDGTIPLPSKYDDFATRCKNFVAHSPGCSIWLIGNELNLAAEWPFDGSRFNYVSPGSYAACFRKVYDAIKSVRPNDKVIPQASAPWAGPYGAGTQNVNGTNYPADGQALTWVQYENQMLTAITNSGPVDGIALHIGSRGYHYADIHSTNKFGSLNLYASFYVYKDWIDYGIPPALYSLPLYVTECNGLYYWKGGGPPGEDPTQHYEPSWMQEIYAEINTYNQTAAVSGKPIFRCFNMYRWCAFCDGWNMDADGGHPNPYKAQILSDLDAAALQRYAWPTNIANTNPPPAPTGLSATVGNGSVTLAWNSAPFATTYRVKRATVNGGPYTVIASNLTATSYLNTSFTPLTPYYYVVSALNAYGESTNSVQVAATPTNGLPDVVVTGIGWTTPGLLYAPTNVFFQATVLNQGSAATPSGTTLGVGFIVDGTQVSWSGGYSLALAPGASVTLTADGGPNNGTSFWIATPGPHTITANADDINRFSEGNENNNTLDKVFVVYARGYAVNSGGAATGSFAADAYWTGSANTFAVTNVIDTSATTNAAPAAVYQSERWGETTYAFPNLVPGTNYVVRLHFAEISPSVTTSGNRLFNVAINGSQVLTNFDIFANAGGKYRAITRQFTVAADSSGQLAIQFSHGAVNEAKINGIEIFAAPVISTVPPTLAAIANKTINEGSTLSFVALGSDPQPGQVITDFESYASGTTPVVFRTPTVSPTTSGFLDAAPNVAAVTSTIPGGNPGTRALNVNFSYKTGAVNPWLRLTTSGSANLPNPIVDFSQSIRFDVYTDRDLKIGLGLRETNPGGNVGEDGGISGPIEYVGVPGLSGSSPNPYRVVPGGSWVTLTFNLTNEPITAFTGNGVLESTTGKGVLEDLALAPAAGNGAYNVFLDNIAVVPASILTYSLSNAPAGAAINVTNGTFVWAPSESQGPGIYTISVRVTKNGVANLVDAKTFTVTVNEVNQAPVLAATGDKTVNAGFSLTFTNTATDPDIPANVWTFSLDPGAPTGAVINSTNGVFSWTAPQSTSRLTNSVSIRVTDNGTPSLSDAKTFKIIVVPPPQFSGITHTNGTVSLSWAAFPGKSYRVQYKNDLGDPSWLDLVPDVLASGDTAFKSDTPGTTQRFYRIVGVN